jgi:hypothetical protein
MYVKKKYGFLLLFYVYFHPTLTRNKYIVQFTMLTPKSYDHLKNCDGSEIFNSLSLKCDLENQMVCLSNFDLINLSIISRFSL